MILSFPFVSASFDADARAYINTSGATDRAAINHFVKGVKKLGLYSSMVCWPLRSSQNAGTGTTAYSLGGLGTYNGTLINGPTWGADGVSFGGNTQRIEYSPQFAVDFTEGGYSVHAVWSGLGVSVAASEGPFVLFGSIGDSISGIKNTITTGVGGGTTWLSQNVQRIEYAPQFAVDFTRGGYSVHAVWSGLGVSVAASEGPFVLFGSIGDSISGIKNTITTGVGGGTTWLSQSRNYNGNRYFQNFTQNLPISGNVGYGWNADTLTLQANGNDIPTGIIPSSTPINGNYTLATSGRDNTSAQETSRVSYVIAISPNIGMTSLSMTSIYNLAKSSLGQGLGLP